MEGGLYRAFLPLRYTIVPRAQLCPLYVYVCVAEGRDVRKFVDASILPLKTRAAALCEEGRKEGRNGVYRELPGDNR